LKTSSGRSGNEIIYCHLVDTKVGNATTLGPYLRTRKGVVIHDKAHIGNFNELKNVDFGEGSKAAHLSYLGDANIGTGVNIGCGTIIANYDGVNKFHSDIGDNAFVGSGSTIISPVKVLVMAPSSLPEAPSTKMSLLTTWRLPGPVKRTNLVMPRCFMKKPSLRKIQNNSAKTH
jgi:bifunctional N-acetylglucosamine-1-phosphate-uridyltransferase/glucosamine-1-phosphate-acetyltransferase GlmU-like protein